MEVGEAKAGSVGKAAVGVEAAAGVEGSDGGGSLSAAVDWSGCTTGGKTEKVCCCQTPCCESHARVVVSCVVWLGDGVNATGVGCGTVAGGGEEIGMVTGSGVEKL